MLPLSSFQFSSTIYSNLAFVPNTSLQLLVSVINDYYVRKFSGH